MENKDKIINIMRRYGVTFSGKKLSSRPTWLYALSAGLVTFIIVACVSTGAAGGGGSKEIPAAKVKVSKATTEETIVPERGRRAYAVRTSSDDGTLELVHEGSRLDVIASFPAGPNGTPVTRTVIDGARLLRFDAGKRLAVMELTPAEAERLAFSEANGQIRLSVCPPGPDAAVRGKGATFEDI